MAHTFVKLIGDNNPSNRKNGVDVSWNEFCQIDNSAQKISISNGVRHPRDKYGVNRPRESYTKVWEER